MVDLLTGGSSGGGGSPADVTDGTTTVSDADPINVSGTNLSSVSVTDPGTGGAEVDVDTVIPTDHIGVNEIDQSIAPTWTGAHQWHYPQPGTGAEQIIHDFQDTDTGADLTWFLNNDGEFLLRTGTNVLMQVDPDASLPPTLNEVWTAALGFISEDFLDHGNNREIRTQYNSTEDSYDIGDGTNSVARARVDRTTGDLTIEGNLTEGATL